jgi:benzil reductase ((S)-benzoin forming)
MDLYVVTGTSRGLGAALAAALRARADVRLVAIGRSQADIVSDLGSADGARQAGEALAALVAGLRPEKAVLINNAGVVEPVGPLESVDAEALARNLQVNLVAPMLLMRAFLGATREVALRRIINISSGAGRRAIFGWSAYCAAKAGLDMATRVVAEEAMARGEPVEAVSLAPGVIDTPMQAVVRGADATAFPDVERFRTMKADGTLRPAADVAADILRLEAAGRFRGDPVRDLRGMD